MKINLMEYLYLYDVFAFTLSLIPNINPESPLLIVWLGSEEKLCLVTVEAINCFFSLRQFMQSSFRQCSAVQYQGEFFLDNLTFFKVI